MSRASTDAFEIGQRVFVGPGENSVGTVESKDWGSVYVKLDSDVTVSCGPEQLSPLDALTDDQVADWRVDLEMMRRPHLWPRRLALHLKRPGGRAVLTIIAARDGLNGRAIRLVMDKGTEQPGPYASFEAIVADGWIVD